MSEKKSTRETTRQVSQPSRRTLNWWMVTVPVVVMLGISAPTMAIEEDWHGHPMIDEPSHLWVIALCVVAFAFFAGGALAARRHPLTPGLRACTAALISIAVLILCAVFRRLWVAGEGVPLRVALLWCGGGVVALLLSAAGSMLAKRRTVRAD